MLNRSFENKGLSEQKKKGGCADPNHPAARRFKVCYPAGIGAPLPPHMQAPPKLQFNSAVIGLL